MKRIGGDEGDRTPGLDIANVALSQLSYIPNLDNHPISLPRRGAYIIDDPGVKNLLQAARRIQKTSKI